MPGFRDLTLEEGGQVVAVGSAEHPGLGQAVVVLGAYRRNGTLNTSFSGDGKAFAAGPLDFAAGEAVFEDPDGRPVVAGAAAGGGSTGRFLVERFRAPS
jgi:hypothetical protein